MALIGEDMILNQDGTLELILGIDELQSKYNLTANELNFVNTSIVNYNYQLMLYHSGIITNAYVKDFHIYLTYHDVAQIMNAVAGVGPAAIAGVMAGMLSVFPGVGIIIGGVVGAFGALTIYGNLAYALSTGRGLRIGLTGFAAY